MIKEIGPQQAFEILSTDPQSILVDVRSSMEYEYVGHPNGSINIPWKEPPGWEVDTGFVDKVRAVLVEKFPGRKTDDLTILAICRSGVRSRSAGEALINNGFLHVYNVAEGFEGDKDENRHRGEINGWRFHGLPWEQG